MLATSNISPIKNFLNYMFPFGSLVEKGIPFV